jgi:hypothetical protein
MLRTAAYTITGGLFDDKTHSGYSHFKQHSLERTLLGVLPQNPYNASIINFLAGESADVTSNMAVSYPKADSILRISALHEHTNQNALDSNIGHFVFDIIVGEGQKGSLTFTASSSASATPVPVPAAVWLSAPRWLVWLAYVDAKADLYVRNAMKMQTRSCGRV